MNKILRLTLMMLLAMVGMQTWADAAYTLTFPDDNKATNGLTTNQYVSTWEAKIGDMTWSISNFNNNNWNNNWSYIKCGRKNNASTGTITNSVAMAKSISSVVVTIDALKNADNVNSIKLEVSSDQSFSSVSETVTASSIKTGEMTFSVSNPIANGYYRLSFDCNSASKNGVVQISKVVYNEGTGSGGVTVTAPEISGETPFTDKTTVTITVPAGTTVYYTTDGSTPTDQGDDYQGPFEISATTTVKAVAYDNAGNHSSEVSKEFVKKATTTGNGTIANPYTVADAIAMTNALPSDTVYYKGTIKYIKEVDTGSFGNGTYSIYTAGSTDTLLVYRGYYLQAAKFTAADQIKVGDEVIVKGKLVLYNGTLELGTRNYIYSLNGKTSADTPVTPTETAANIAAFNALSNNTLAVLTLTNAVVLYSWTTDHGNNSTYIRDASGAMLLYNSGIELKEGDVLNGTINVTRTAYNNNIQAAKNDNTNADNLTITSGSAPEPKTIASTEASSYANDLVLIKDVDIVANDAGTRFYIVSGSDSLQVYNGFHLDGYTVAAASKVIVKGIVVNSRYGYEIQPTEDPATTTTGITSIKDAEETNVNAPAYNLAGQRVGRDYKGVVIQNGKKHIRK